MDGDETQEFMLDDLGPPQEAYWQPGHPMGSAVPLTERFASPALGATPRRVHSARNADLARVTWRLGIVVLVLCVLVLAGGAALEIVLFSMIP